MVDTGHASQVVLEEKSAQPANHSHIMNSWRLVWLSGNMLREHYLRTSEVENKGPSRSSPASSVKTLDSDGVSYRAPTSTSDHGHYSQSLRAAWDAMRRRGMLLCFI